MKVLKSFKKIGVVVAALAIAGSVSSPAFAGSGAHTGPATSCGSRNLFGLKITAGGGRSAWDNFDRALKGGNGTCSRVYRTDPVKYVKDHSWVWEGQTISGDKAVELCKQSNRIWYIASKKDGNPYGGAGAEPGGTFGPQLLNATPGSYDDKYYVAAHSPRGTNVICDGFSERPYDFWVPWSSEIKKTITGDYSYKTTVTPVSIEGKYPGGGEYETQGSDPVKTEFGKFYDGLASSYSGWDIDKVNNTAASKVQSDSSSGKSSPTVTLSEKNKAAFAKGGVLNVSEYTTKATINLSTTETRWYKCTYKGTNAEDARSKWYRNGSPWSVCHEDPQHRNRTPTYVMKNTQTPENTGFFQMISVHCNKEQFEALVNATGATVTSQGDPERGISAVAQSKKYDKKPAKTDFGDKTNGNAAAAASGTMGFYDKECPFDCKSDSSGQGASSGNGANTNIQNGNAGADGKSGTVSGLYGAKSSEVNGNRFQFFRDNQDKKIDLDVWYPVSNDTVKYDGKQAVTTTVTRWSDGTPSVTGEEGGKFTATAIKTDGSKVGLFNGNDQVKVQKNWDVNTFSNSTSTIVPGSVKSLNVKASWASEDNRPQILNVKWEYNPDVVSTFPSVLGFGHNGKPTNALTTNPVNVNTPVQGKCYANFGKTSSNNTVGLYKDNTGTGTSNGLDGQIVGGIANPGTNNTNLIINFVRSTTE